MNNEELIKKIKTLQAENERLKEYHEREWLDLKKQLLILEVETIPFLENKIRDLEYMKTLTPEALAFEEKRRKIQLERVMKNED